MSLKLLVSLATVSVLLAGCGSDNNASPSNTSAQDPSGAGVSTKAIGTPSQSSWSAVINLPLVPASIANLPNGNVMMWAGDSKFGFASSPQTYSLIYNPGTGSIVENFVTATGHEMFCSGTSNLADGRILVSGGSNAEKTSIFDASTGAWSAGATMKIPRAYHANALLQDGRVLALGGSWNGGSGGKDGEVWSATSGWTRLSGVPITPFITTTEVSRPSFAFDSHFWLIPSGNGKVLYAGPGVNMSWIDTSGNGKVTPIGPRGNDEFSINGNTVMYDIGKILKVGGAHNYTDTDAAANANAFVIDVNNRATVRRIGSMKYPRTYHNSVVLPNGQVVIMGGQTYGRGFSDSDSVMVPELFDPATETFTTLPAMSVPRNYHSVAALMPDGRVVSAGGGLCGVGCAANHADMQILTPHYLYNADGSTATRPVIVTAPSLVEYGTSVAMATDSAISSFVMVRMASTTHTVNNDQRRIPLTFSTNGTNQYTVQIPSNPGWALPGYYMVFAMNTQGTPSVAKIVRLSGDHSPRLPVIDDQYATSGGAYSLQIAGSHPDGAALTYSAIGLPGGLSINSATGQISGVPTNAGNYTVSVTATDGNRSSSTLFSFTVAVPGGVRFVRFEELSEINGNAWGSAAEINLLDGAGNLLNRSGWTVTADSAELTGENGVARNAIDGNPATIWHTQWQAANPPPPHWFQVDLGASYTVGGIKYLPRQDGGINGTFAKFRVWLSADGVNWGGAPAAEGNMLDFGAGAAERTVYFTNLARGKSAQQSSTYGGQLVLGASAAVDGNTNGAFGSGSLTHTNADINSWWEVDLGSINRISTVRLWNRTDCCADRLSNFYVFASDNPMVGRSMAQLVADTSVKRFLTPGVAGQSTAIDFNTTGRYVRVQLASTTGQYLSLAEVEVLGQIYINRPPSISTPVAQSMSTGDIANLQIAAVDPDNDPLTYAASGLPTGLSINTATGLITGTASASGSFTVTATATDSRGATASTSFSWTVIAAAPVISPITTSVVTAGGQASYTVTASGNGALQYNWDFGDGTSPTGFGSTSSVSHVYAASGVYNVTVTVRAADGSTTTRSFLQAVTLPVASGYASGLASSNILYETRTNASGRIWVANPDTATVSVIDTATNARVAEIAVGDAPRSLTLGPDGRVWVVGKTDATLSRIDKGMLAVTSTVNLPRASQPYGIVTIGSYAYVTLEATGQLLKLTSTGAEAGRLNLGGSPRHLSRDIAGTNLLVSHFVTAPQPGEGTLTVATQVGGIKQGGSVSMVAASTMTLARTITLQHSDKADSTVQGRGVPNYLGAATPSPDGKSAWVPSKQDNIQRGTARDGNNLDFQNTVRSISSRIDLATGAEDYAARVDHDNNGVASTAAFHPTGAYLFVTLQASRQVAVVDPGTRRELFRVEAGLAPDGLALSPDGKRLYVHNFMSRNVMVYDLTQLISQGQQVLPVLATVPTIASEKLSATVLKGKQLFYDARDPRLSRDAYLSCAACHNDGGHDGRTWDLTGFGEGIRNTASLRGRAGGQGRLHWTGNFDEVQDFEGQIRAMAQGTGLMSDALFNMGTRSLPLGDPKAGLSADLDALAAYVGSLNTFAPTPFRQANGVMTTTALAGKTVFDGKCASCHSGDPYTNSAGGTLFNVGTIKASSGKRLGGTLTGLDTPTLRDVWSTGPYLHDGSAPTISAAISAHTTLSLTTTDLTNVTAFVQQIGGEAQAPTATTNLLINGGFETNAIANGGWGLVTNLSGWVNKARAVEVWRGLAGYQSADGNSLIELDANGNSADEVSQTVATQPGQLYTLRFSYSGRPGVAAASNRFSVYWNGVLLGTFAPEGAGLSGPNWFNRSFLVTGTGGNVKIAFTEGGADDGVGALIDAVSLVPTTR